MVGGDPRREFAVRLFIGTDWPAPKVASNKIRTAPVLAIKPSKCASMAAGPYRYTRGRKSWRLCEHLLCAILRPLVPQGAD